MSIFKDPETGQWMELVGSQMRPLEGVNPDQMEIARRNAENSGKLETFGMGIANAAGAGWWGDWESPEQYEANMLALQEKNPWSYTGGNVAAMIPAAIASGGSIPATMATEAAMGALGNRNNPLEGAAWGAGLGGAGTGLGTIVDGARAGRQAGANLPVTQQPRGTGMFASAGGDAPKVPLTMSERVAQKIATSKTAQVINKFSTGINGVETGVGSLPILGGKIASGAQKLGNTGDPAMMKGFIGVDEAGRLGIPLSQGDKAVLAATDDASMSVANQIRAGEELRRTDKFTGAGINQIRDAQKEYGTNFIKKELGIEGVEKLTPATMGETITRLGKGYDDIAEQIGSVAVLDDTMDGLMEVVDNAPRDYKNQMNKVYKMVEDRAQRGGGQLDFSDWIAVKGEIARQMKSAVRQKDFGKQGDLAEFQDVLQQSVMNGLGTEGKAQMAQLNRQYKIAKTLMNNRNAIGKGGDINPVTFANAWLGKSNQGYKVAGEDQISRTFNTLAKVTEDMFGSSGTAQRMLANPISSKAAFGSGLATMAGGAGGWVGN